MTNTRVNYQLYGGNAAGYNSREKEVLISGPAGTGKSLAAMLKVHTLAELHPGSRHLLLRNARADLTEAALVTFERDVLGERNPILTESPNQRKVRQSYRYPNGSEVICGGIDKPGKTLSTEYDTIYIQEVTELELDKYETMLRSLRADRVHIKGEPFTQIISDCNPTFPHHWLYKRFTSGTLRNCTTTHRDNPKYWDREKQEWTKKGKQYLETLNLYTGFRRKRFLEGVWAAAEGLVYDGFGPHNILPRGWRPPSDWPRFHALDFGYTNPLCYQFWARDWDGRLYLYREIYRTGYLVEDLARWVKSEIEQNREPMPQQIIGDSADAEGRATFTRHSGIFVRLADKSPSASEKHIAGIQDVQNRLPVLGDGRPRLYVVEGACEKPDESLGQAGKPSCTQEEFASYVWNPEKDNPVDNDNHGMDAMRYLCRHLRDEVVVESVTTGREEDTIHGRLPAGTFD